MRAKTNTKTNSDTKKIITKKGPVQNPTQKKNTKKRIREYLWKKCPVPSKKLKLYKFRYQGLDGPNPNYITPDMKTPLSFYSLFLTDELLDKIAAETNRYAEQCIVNRIVDENLKETARLIRWKETNRDELRNFIAIVMWMGLDQKPTLAHYWSSNPLYDGTTRNYMSRNRLELLLRYIHFSDNENCNTADKMHKLGSILDYLNDQFSKMYIPGDKVCIDETMMSFKGRLGFKQYIPNKRHKWGIKFFKLCLPHGYTYRFKVYCGNENDREDDISLSEDVVMKLCENILDEKRTLYVDNFYTSVSLASRLLKRKTHLVGTLRSNRKNNPKTVQKKKLERGIFHFQKFSK